MDRRRIELLPEACKATVLPLSLTAHYKNESTLLAKDRFYLLLPYSFSLVDFQNLVDCMGLEPMSDQECGGAHSIMLLRLFTVHETNLDNP